MGAFTVDEAPSKFSITQTAMFLQIFQLFGIHDMLLVDMVIRWKCIYSEFCAILTQVGVGQRYLKSFCATESLSLAGKSNPNEDDFLKVAKEHEMEVKKVVQHKGSEVFQVLFQQTAKQIQESLCDDQILLEYCLSPTYFGVDKYGSENGVTGVLILLQPAGHQPIVKSIDFVKLQALTNQYAKEIPKAAIAEVTSTQPGGEAKVIAKSIRQLILIPEVEELIVSRKVKRIYICTDFSMSILPFDLLPFDDDEVLGQKCSIAYLSSSRELLRQKAICEVYRLLDENACNIPDVNAKECIVFADPNYNLRLENKEQSSWDNFIVAFSAFFSHQTKPVHPLPQSRIEAEDIELILTASDFKVNCYLADSATLMRALHVISPYILHFSTHGFSIPATKRQRQVFQQNFWSNIETGIVLAGVNTYRQKMSSYIVEEAGTGELNALAVAGMNLKGTSLVFLSSCSSSFGTYTSGESMKSLAEAFRSAGARTVIATLWPVFDEQARKLAVHFYYAAVQPGVAPSVALSKAKIQLQQEYGHWVHGSAFVCVGEDAPLVPVI